MPTVYCYLVLDILHIGHLRMLERAHALADGGQLIAGILTDEAAMERKVRPILPFAQRAEIACGLRSVDRVVEQSTYSPLSNVHSLRPDILIESDSHTDADIALSRSEMEKIGGTVVVIPYFNGVSSTLIKRNVFESYRALRTGEPLSGAK